VAADCARYEESYSAAKRYFREKYGAAVDDGAKGLTRLCYVSHDPDLWTRPDAVPLPILEPEPEASDPNTPTEASAELSIIVLPSGAVSISESARVIFQRLAPTRTLFWRGGEHRVEIRTRRNRMNGFDLQNGPEKERTEVNTQRTMSKSVVAERVIELPIGDAEIPALVLLNKWGRQLGRTPPTLWRWRQLGWLDGITNIAGKPYITRQGIEKFLRRAQAGEFSKPSHAPHRVKSSLP
jgi:hypothetical protein